MFGMFRKRAKPDFAEIRDLLFGDVPLSDWKPRDGKSDKAEPWSSSESARVAVARRDSRGAVNVLRSVVDARGLESRQYLQVWGTSCFTPVSASPTPSDRGPRNAAPRRLESAC